MLANEVVSGRNMSVKKSIAATCSFLQSKCNLLDARVLPQDCGGEKPGREALQELCGCIFLVFGHSDSCVMIHIHNDIVKGAHERNVIELQRTRFLIVITWYGNFIYDNMNMK
jgi:hypothetical protein